MTNLGQPFKVAIPENDLDALKQRLALTRFPDELDEAKWNYGAPLADVKRLVAHWLGGYDWPASEREINKLPQFTRDIAVDGFGKLNIHYVHQKSMAENAVPLLFVHGWPGNFTEVQKILPLLTAVSPNYPSFHVVAMSLPGFGFSEAPTKRGFKAAQYAEVGNRLMVALGYPEYVTQGGDWGFWITRKMAELYGGKTVKAWHTNFANGAPPRVTSHPLLFLKHMLTPYTNSERTGHARTKWFETWSYGYGNVQNTRPQTLGYALGDSPVGLLAWIYEKLVEWSDAYSWTDDEVLTWASIYWFSRAGPAATLRIYYEFTNGGDHPRVLLTHGALMGVSYFPRELVIQPSSWIHASGGNVVFESTHEHGGHFAAHEQPEALVEDLRRMFGRGGPAHGVVKGISQYARPVKAKL